MMGDHRSLEEQLSHIIAQAEATNHTSMPMLWSEFDARTRAHMDAEEQYLLPALLRWRKSEARAVVEEHKLIRRRLGELATVIGNRDVNVRDLRRFLDELSAHGRIEERRVYEWADEHFNASAKDTLLANITRAIASQPIKGP